MTSLEDRAYRFSSLAHWRSGVRSHLEAAPGGELVTPRRYDVERIDGTTARDATDVMTFDPCGRLWWMRSDRVLFRESDPVPLRVARLGTSYAPSEADDALAETLVVGWTRAWLVLRDEAGVRSLERYEMRGFQRLSPFQTEGPLLDICTDGDDGVWCLLGPSAGRKTSTLERYGPGGRRLDVVEIEEIAFREARLEREPAGSLLVLGVEVGKEERVLVRCAPSGATPERISYRSKSPARAGVNAESFVPARLVVDRRGHIYLLGEECRSLRILEATGEVVASPVNVLPDAWGPMRSLAAAEDLVVSGDLGIARLQPSERAEATRPGTVSTFITPMLHSPDGAVSGWSRADLEIRFGEGTLVEIDHATASTEIEREQMTLLLDDERSPAQLADELDRKLDWRASLSFLGEEWPSGRSLRYPLDRVEAPYLWLRVRIHTSLDTEPAYLSGLRVRYPDRSLTRYLPAIYREDEVAHAGLRRFSMIFECVFDALDHELDDLPRRIDPDTAPDAWVPFLLRWLGMPSADGLTLSEQRALLHAAPWLLQGRGTEPALRGLLETLDGIAFAIEDVGAEAAPWTLPAGRRATGGARLGEGTLVLDAPQPRAPVPLDVRDLFARRRNFVDIRISASPVDRRRLEPFLLRALPQFVPAQCRFRLRFVPPSQLRQRLHVGDRLIAQGDEPVRIGDDARPGELRLARDTVEGGYLDSTSFLDDDLFLQ